MSIKIILDGPVSLINSRRNRQLSSLFYFLLEEGAV